MTTPPAEPGSARSRLDPFRWVIEHPGQIDAIAFGAAAVLILGFAAVTGNFGWWTLFTLPMVAAAAVCRIRPGLGVALIGSLALLHVVVNIPVVLGDVLTFYAMFCAISYGTPVVHAAGVGAGFLGVLVQAGYWAVFSLRDVYGSPAQALFAFLALLVVGSITITAIWALANLQRARVRQLALTRERAEQAVREREQRTALAVAEERSRIAREMHDVVAHSLSVIIAQADGGRFIASQQPERANDVLSTIGETGREALADMRSLLGVLRQDDQTTYGPQPGPERLDELVERVRSAGVPVTLERDTELADLPQATGLSLFRLVQEALTNVLKHAGPQARARVRIARHAQMLTVEILDDGRGNDPASGAAGSDTAGSDTAGSDTAGSDTAGSDGAGSDGAGNGLTGMRERVTVLGGTLQAGPLPGHGFRVLAQIPLPPPPPPQTPASPGT